MEKSTISLLSSEDIAAIKSMGEALDKAAKESDWDALTALFTEDVVFMPPNSPLVEGSTTVKEWIESLGIKMTDHSIVFTDIGGAGDIAYVQAINPEAYTIKGVATPFENTNKILGVLLRQPDNSWKIKKWCWNTDSE
jgi:ketosteroid isomerase-like protein